MLCPATASRGAAVEVIQSAIQASTSAFKVEVDEFTKNQTAATEESQKVSLRHDDVMAATSA